MKPRTALPCSRRQFVGSATAISAAAAFGIPGALRGALPEKIKIGQIGTKHSHAAGKMNAIRSNTDDYEIVGVVEPDAARRRSVEGSATYRGLTWMTEAELLGTDGLRVVAVETDVPDLVPTGLRCVRAGKHIHLDKPAGESMAACRELHAEATRRGLTIQMGYMLRYNPGFQFVFQVVRDGWLGEITEIDGMMGKKAGADLRKDLERFAGGGMFELACHLIDAVVGILGEPTNVTPFVRRSHPERDTFADNQMAVFEYPKAIAAIRCNHIDPLGFARRQFTVTGTEGTVEIRPLEPPQVRLGLDRPRGPFKKGFQEVQVPAASGRYDAEFADLARVVRGEKDFAWNSEHDLIVHRAVLRASGLPAD